MSVEMTSGGGPPPSGGAGGLKIRPSPYDKAKKPKPVFADTPFPLGPGPGDMDESIAMEEHNTVPKRTREVELSTKKKKKPGESVLAVSPKLAQTSSRWPRDPQSSRGPAG